MSGRRPSRDERDTLARLFAPPEPEAPRATLWELMAHRQGTCGGPGTCPLCPPPAKGPVEGSAA